MGLPDSQPGFIVTTLGAGTFPAHLGIARPPQNAAMVRRRQDWPEHALGGGYNQDTDKEDCLSPKQFIDKVIDGVSRNGNFDINVGPTAAGLIPDYEQYPLLQMGEWLGVNGEAIYGTRYGSTQKEGEARFTAKGDYVYALFLKWPGEEFKLKSVKPVAGSAITMLGVPGNLEWTWNEASGLTIKYPRQKGRPTPCSYAWALKIKIQ
jgi:alpha-L-fucosidase